MNRFSSKENRGIVQGNRTVDDAYMDYASQQNPSAWRVQTIDLSTASVNPFQVSIPFKCVYVVAGTDTSVRILMQPFSASFNNDPVPLTLKDVLSVDRSANGAYLTWESQPGKSITLVFFTDAQFTSGSFLNQVVSGVDGSSVSPQTPVALTGTGAQVLPQDTSRTVANIYASDAWELSDSTETIWFPMPAGYSVIQNTAEIRGRSSYGANLAILVEA